MNSVKQAAICARQVVTPSDVWEDGVVEISHGKVKYLGHQSSYSSGEVTTYSGHYLIPGMIDLQLNGSGGGDLSGGTVEDIERVGRSLAAHGTTGYLATIVTNQTEKMMHALHQVSEQLSNEFSGARSLGIHLEGPFINPAKRGAHLTEYIVSPDLELFRHFLKASRYQIKMLTIAPELPSAREVIREARDQIPIVSAGHTMAGYDEGLEAIRNGINFATHIFNAMPALHHREPGLIGAVLDSEEVVAGVIPDGVHLHPSILRLVSNYREADKTVYVSDAISAADMPDGEYRVGSLNVTVRNGVARDSHGNLAGSTLTLDQALKNLVEWLVEDSGVWARRHLKEIVAALTLIPAELIGMKEKGRIEVGADADLVLLDADFNVLRTWVNGELVFQASEVASAEENPSI